MSVTLPAVAALVSYPAPISTLTTPMRAGQHFRSRSTLGRCVDPLASQVPHAGLQSYVHIQVRWTRQALIVRVADGRHG
jgi:hypothetical protein